MVAYTKPQQTKKEESWLRVAKNLGHVEKEDNRYQ